MCGIIGYVGQRKAEPLLVEGLRRLEYRGYDSAGLATLQGACLHLRKCAGRVADLARHLRERPAPGGLGIGHTRWATHGPATDTNAHPHASTDGRVVVVHNGVIENYAMLRRGLEAGGVVFRSDTDTEVIAQLIAHHLADDLMAATHTALARLQGSYAVAVLSPCNPGMLIGASSGAPLVVGLGQGEYFLASDPGALAGITDEVVFLQERQMCALGADSWQMFDDARQHVPVNIEAISSTAIVTEKGDFEHYMLKEIYEQPLALKSALHMRLDPGTHGFAGMEGDESLLRADRLLLTACGTSYHAALLGKYLFEELARIPVEVEYASEFRYRNPPTDPRTLVVAISQSGETADTLAALRQAKLRGHPTLAVCNVTNSTLAREADGMVPLRAGPEIGVASTKAFTCQVAVLTALALQMARTRQLSERDAARIAQEIATLPDAVRDALECQDAVRRVAERYCRVDNFLYLGRQYLYPLALEGALKMKEISYIHAEGYPAAEMKHGPLALVDADTPSVFFLSRGHVYDKVMSNLEEVKARGGPVIAVACNGCDEAAARADEILYVPEVSDYLQPLVSAVPVQLLAYHIALLRDCDVDKPRNLAKSVTVE
ncbi:MAG: glutamine--fructose-6-phosphate transaminase (isomerizing) [Gemmataceae bacterium]|nr:glutamine--fructose-6-phosphate transaminase (isomerizing) [Gemmataceae bacterium]